jgi:hypothetical protein
VKSERRNAKKKEKTGTLEKNEKEARTSEKRVDKKVKKKGKEDNRNRKLNRNVKHKPGRKWIRHRQIIVNFKATVIVRTFLKHKQKHATINVAASTREVECSE